MRLLGRCVLLRVLLLDPWTLTSHLISLAWVRVDTFGSFVRFVVRAVVLRMFLNSSVISMSDYLLLVMGTIIDNILFGDVLFHHFLSLLHRYRRTVKFYQVWQNLYDVLTIQRVLGDGVVLQP